MKNYCAHCITWCRCVLWNPKLLCTVHHMMSVCVVESKTIVRTASRDVGVCCGIQNYCAHCITQCRCVLLNEKLLCALHHRMSVCVADEKTILCAMHHVMQVWLAEWKTIMRTASCDVGVCYGMKNYCAPCITGCPCVLWNEKQKTIVRPASQDVRVCCGMKNYCARCITWCRCALWNQKLLCALHQAISVECFLQN